MPNLGSGSSSGGYGLANLERRYKILADELPELDGASLYSLANSSADDAEMISTGLKTLAAGSMDRVVKEFQARPKSEQRFMWKKMSAAKQELFQQHGYKSPSASGTPLWQKPFAGISWVTDKLMLDDLIENAKIVEGGQWALTRFTEFADNIAGRNYRWAKDRDGKEQEARIETRLNQAIAQLKDEGFGLSAQEEEYLKWKILDEDPEFVNRSTGFQPLDTLITANRAFNVTGIAQMSRVAETIASSSEIPTSLKQLTGSVQFQPYRNPKDPINLSSNVFERFKEINENLKNGKEFSMRPQDAWDRVDDGRTNVLASQQLNLQEKLRGQSASVFNAALELGRGRQLVDYIEKDEKLEKQSPEFTARFQELSQALSNPEVQDEIEKINRDQSKVSLGRDFARSLFIPDDSAIFTLVSGAVDAAVVLTLDPLLLAGKGVKVARVAKAITAAEDISELQRFSALIRAGAQVGEDGKVIFRPIEQISDDLINAESKLAELKTAGESTTKQAKKVSQLRRELDARNAITQFDQSLVTATNDTFKQLANILGEDTLRQYGIESVDDLLDEVGNATDYLTANRGKISLLLDETYNEFNSLVETSRFMGDDVEGLTRRVLDPDFADDVVFETGPTRTSKFGFDKVPFGQLQEMANGLRASRYVVARSQNVDEIAAAYNEFLTGANAGIRSDADRIAQFLSRNADGQSSIPKVAQIVGTRARTTAQRLRHATKVNAWADRVAASFVDYENGATDAFLRVISDIPDVVSVFDNLRLHHELLKQTRGFGISSADDIFEFWKMPQNMLDLAAGKSTNQAIRGFGSGKLGMHSPKLWVSSVDDMPLISQQTRASFIMMPTYKGNKLMRRTLNKLSGERFNRLSEAIELGADVRATASRRSLRVAQSVVKAQSKFMYALTRQLPRNNFVDLNDIEEIKRWIDSTTFLGFSKGKRDAIWQRVLSGFDTDQTIRIMQSAEDATALPRRFMSAQSRQLAIESGETAVPKIYNSVLADEFFETFGWNDFLYESNDTFRATEWFNESYDDIQRWINSKTENMTYTQINEDDFLKDILAFKRDTRPTVSIATRRAIVEDAISQMFEAAGFKNTAGGRKALEEFMGRFSNQRYSALDNDVVSFAGTARRIGILPLAHQSTNVAIPSYERALQGADTLGLTSRLLRQSTRGGADALISKYWKPYTLLRIGFIPRAVGEEALAFIAKSSGAAAQAILGSFATKEKVANVSQLLWKAARRTIRRFDEDAFSLWDDTEFVKKYGDFIEAVGFESLREYRDDILKEFDQVPITKWDNYGVHASYIAASVAKKIRNFEYSLIPDYMKATLPGQIRTERQKLLYEKMGYLGVDKSDVTALAKIARTLLRGPENPMLAQVSMANVGNTIADSSLGGFAPFRGRTIEVKPFGTESYTLKILQDKEWVVYNINDKVDEELLQVIAYPYALSAIDPTSQVGFDSVRGVVTPAEAQDELSVVADALGLYIEPTAVAYDDDQIALLESLLAGFVDDSGAPLFNSETVVAARLGQPKVTAQQQRVLQDFVESQRIAKTTSVPQTKFIDDFSMKFNNQIVDETTGLSTTISEMSDDILISYYLATDTLPQLRDELVTEFRTRIYYGDITEDDIIRLANDPEFESFVRSSTNTQVDLTAATQNLPNAYADELANGSSRGIRPRGEEVVPEIDTRALDLPTYSAIMDEISEVLNRSGSTGKTRWIQSPEIRDTVTAIIDQSGRMALPEISLRTPKYVSSDQVVEVLNNFSNRLSTQFTPQNREKLLDFLQNPSKPLAENHWLRSQTYNPLDFSPVEAELIERFGVNTEMHKLIQMRANRLKTLRGKPDEAQDLIANFETIVALLDPRIKQRYLTLVADDAPIVIRTFEEQQKIIEEVIYQQLARMQRDPATAHLINGSERMLYSIDSASPNNGMTAIRAPRPESMPNYNVMANRQTVDFLQKVVNEGRQAELLYAMRASGVDERTVAWLNRIFLEWDSETVNRMINHNLRMMNGDYLSFTRFGFETYDDALALSSALENLKVPAIDIIPGEFNRLRATPGLVEVPSVFRTIPDDSPKAILRRAEEDGLIAFSDETFVTKSKPFTSDQVFRYDEAGNLNPRGAYAMEGVSVETLMRDWARVISEEFQYHYQSPTGYLHEIIVPSRRGKFGVDVFRSVPKTDLPGKVYAPKEYVAPRNISGDIVRFGFDRIINPPIQAMVRTPQWFLNFTEGYVNAVNVVRSLRDPKLEKYIASIFTKYGADDELLKDLWAQIRFAHDNPMGIVPEDIPGVVHDLIAREIFDPSVLDSIEYRLLIGETPETAVDILRWVRRDAHIEDLVRDTAYSRAVDATIPYIDDHSVRSIFQAHVRSIMPFQFAQEAFIKRWLRTVAYSPEAIRRAQLLAHSFTTLPFMEKTPDGETLLVVPFSEAASEFIGRSLTPLFGDNVRIPISVPLSLNVKYMLPGIPNDFGQLPTLSPLGAFPARVLVNQFPEIAGLQTRDLLRPFTGGMPIRSGENLLTGILESFMPTQYARMASGIFGGFGRYGQEMQGAAIGAVQMMAAEALRLRAEAKVAESEGDFDGAASLYDRANELLPPDNATAIQQERFLDSVRDFARAMMFVKGFTGWFSPTTPRENFEGMEFSEEFANLMNYLPLAEATAFYLTEHPDRQPYTIFTYDKETTAPLPATERSLEWMDRNRDILKEYKYGAPWLFPQQNSNDEFSQQAFADQVGSRMRFNKSLDDWYRDMKYAAAGNIYFPEQEAYFLALDQATSSAERAAVESKWRLWADTFKKQHPVFAEELVKNFDTRVESTLNEVKTLLNDPGVEKVEHHDALREMVNRYEAYKNEIDFLQSDNSKEGRKRRLQLQENFIGWGSEFIISNRVLTSFWNTVIIPATNLRRRQTLMQLVGGQ